MSDESAVVGRLQATEALVRQQAEEKRRLQEQLAYYRQLLEAAGLLPKSSPSKTPPSRIPKSASMASSLPRVSSAGDLGHRGREEQVMSEPPAQRVRIYLYLYL